MQFSSVLPLLLGRRPDGLLFARLLGVFWLVVFTCVHVCVFLACETLKAVPMIDVRLTVHVKLKVATPERYNLLFLMTTACPEMTAGRSPIPINPLLPLVLSPLRLHFFSSHHKRVLSCIIR